MCFFILGSGLIIYLLGRFFPRKLIKEKSFPFKSYKWEKNGNIYEKLNIKKWKTKLPDASLIMHKIFPKHIPIKRFEKFSKDHIPILIKESCVAEITHTLALITSFVCVKIWEGLGGWIVSIIYSLSNIPFILIQRYNRPRLIQVLDRI